MNQLSTRRGDTLIEVVLSLAILTTVMVAATTAAISAWQSSLQAGERTQATNLAQQQADLLKAAKSNMGWSNFSDPATWNPGSSQCSGKTFFLSDAVSDCKVTGTKAIATAPSGAGSNTLPLANTYTVGVKASSSSAGVVTFTVSVDWQSTGSKVQNSVVQTIEMSGS